MQTVQHSVLVAQVPSDPAQRLFLFGIRRLGCDGLHDAAVAHAFLIAFGAGFRRQMMAMRAFVTEVARHSNRTIQLSPWCCGRATADEIALCDAVRLSVRDPARASLLLADVLGRRDCAGVVGVASWLAQGFADAGMPIEAG